MRRRFLAEIGPNGTWPENPGVSGGAGTPAVDPFSWVRWENRGLADVVMSIDGAIEAPGGTPNPRQYWDYIPAGEANVRNIGKPAATELHLRNVDPAVTALIWLELDTEPIVDLGNTRVLLDRSRKGISASNPLNVNANLTQGSGQSLGTSALNADDNPSGYTVPVSAFLRLYNPGSGNYERVRTPSVFKGWSGTVSSVVWTPAAGKKLRLLAYRLMLSADVALAAAQTASFYLSDSVGGGVSGTGSMLRWPAAAGAGSGALYDSGWSALGGNGYLGGAVNSTLSITLPAALTSGQAFFQGVGTEE